MIDQFDPFFQFWTTASGWKVNKNSWLHDPWEKLNGEVVEREVNNAFKTLYKTAKVFGQRGQEKCAENCEVVRAEVEDFKQYVPLVQVRPGGRAGGRGGGCCLGKSPEPSTGRRQVGMWPYVM